MNHPKREARRVPGALTAVLAAAALAGCAMTPDYQRPAMAVPDRLPSATPVVAQDGTAGAAAAAMSVADVPWTRYFPDPRLQQLIRLSLAHNRDLRVAALNIDRLQAAYQIQRAERLPTLNAVISGTRQPSAQPPYDLSTVVNGGITVSAFELDLFGRVRALTEAAAAQVLGSEANRRAVHNSLVSAVASTYYTLWADRWQLALAEQTLETRQASLRLQQLKFDNGVLNELELRSAQSLVEAARVARAQAQRQWQQDLNALQVLVGTAVPESALPPAVTLPPLPAAGQLGDLAQAQAQAQQWVSAALWPDLAELPVGMSSEVLLQRPDIAQAEQALLAANANIGAARAARFPRIALTASAGVVSDSLSGLFDDGRSAWSFAPSISLPIFDAGRARANVAVAEVQRDIAVAQYDQTIQGAFREAADALVARQSYAEQAAAQRAQAEAEAARLRLSTLRYETGVASQLDLLDAQRALFAAQQALIGAQLARQQAHIAVYKALGGGWATEAQTGAQPVAQAVAARSAL
jgi:NodT family efflux transporter outer membrane factor (OMF) lipoprotein